jgi:hypothetical protein
MDGGRFDAWTRTLTSGATSRRTALRSVASAALSALVARSGVPAGADGCAGGGEPCEFGGLCCSGVCAIDGTCCRGPASPGARCRRHRQCCSGRCVGRQCVCRLDQRLCRGVCLASGQCCSDDECGEGEVCNDFDHFCCPADRVATHRAPPGLETCGCCCTRSKCSCPCGDRCRKARGECLEGCCCDEDDCECPPAGAAFPYTSCCGEGSLGDVGGNPGCCTTPPNMVVCPGISRARR